LINFIIKLVQIILLLIIILLAINYSFVVSIEIQDFIYSIPSTYFLIGFLIFFFIIFLLQSLYFKLKFNLSKYRVNKVNKDKQKGYDSFLNGMIALANKDYKKAILESKKTANYLKDNPSLSLLLKSEIYKIEKKYDQLNQVYEDMSKNLNTENLAYRGLMQQYLKAQDYHHAFIYGEKLFNKNPFVEKIYDTLVNIVAKTNNWQQLLNITNKAYSKKIIDKGIFQENKSIALFEIAKVKQYSEVNESINYIQKALALRKNFPPYIKLYLEILIYNKDLNYAKKFLKRVWNDKPHEEYKSVIINLAHHLNKDVLELTKDIVGNKQTEESKILLVESSIASKKWDEARNQIRDLLDTQPKKEVCLLMAKIEKGDANDVQKVNSWMLRSKNGANKNVWICMISKKIQNEWTSLSEGGYFNSLEWKQPIMLNEQNLNHEDLLYEN